MIRPCPRLRIRKLSLTDAAAHPPISQAHQRGHLSETKAHVHLMQRHQMGSHLQVYGSGLFGVRHKTLDP